MKNLKTYLQENWDTFIGWALAFCFFINCVVAPYLNIKAVDWLLLVGLLGVLTNFKNFQECTSGCERPDKKKPRHWIIIIGWTLCIGMFSNGTIGQFMELNPVNWGWMMTALAVLIAAGTDRDRRLKRLHDSYNNKRMWILFTAIALALSIATSGIVVCLEALINYDIISLNWSPVEIDWYYLIIGVGIVGGNEAFTKIYLTKAGNVVNNITKKAEEDAKKLPEEINKKEKDSSKDEE